MKLYLNLLFTQKRCPMSKKTHFSSLLELVSEELIWLNLMLGLSQIILWHLPIMHEACNTLVWSVSSFGSYLRPREKMEVDWDFFFLIKEFCVCSCSGYIQDKDETERTLMQQSKCMISVKLAHLPEPWGSHLWVKYILESFWFLLLQCSTVWFWFNRCTTWNTTFCWRLISH